MSDNVRTATPHEGETVEIVIASSLRDLGDGFTVRRALPSIGRRAVGPFVFFDQMGSVTLGAGKGLDVRPHPHIGLSTLTYLFEGQILHRDSLGTVQAIQAGAVNWMTAGHGIVHSERTPPTTRRQGGPLYGFQTWLALPHELEECPPAFDHYAAETIPFVAGDGWQARVIVGHLFGVRSPVVAFTETLYADVRMQPQARLNVESALAEERALYIVEGQLTIVGRENATFGPGQMLVVKPGVALLAVNFSHTSARAILLGGDSLDRPRHLWWNFVSTSRERIEQAKADWRSGRFGAVPEETEFIPLPADPPAP